MRALRASLNTWRPSGAKLDPLDAVRALWPQLVGTEVARHAVPVAIEGQKLVVHTRSGAWSNELSFLVPNFLASLAALPDAPTITEMHFRVGRIRQVVAVSKPKRSPVQANLRLIAADVPANLTLAELVERMRARCVEREARLKRQPRCRQCGLPLEGGVTCAPCRGKTSEEQLRAAQRLLREMPWLSVPQMCEFLPGMEMEACARARRNLQHRFEQRIEQLRWHLRGGGVVKSHDRTLALTYVMLVSGEPPQMLSDALLQTMLGRELATKLYEGENPARR